jgi:Zn-dependent protease
LSATEFAQIFIAFLVLLFSLTVHESAHALAANRCGDPTARLLGRVSLNPLVHIDLVGTVLFPLLAALGRMPMLGWAKPVPIDVTRLNRPRRDAMLVAAAGPASNLALAVIAAASLRLIPLEGARSEGFDLALPLAMLAVRGVEINVLLAVFNLLPIPPLDGGSVLSGLLPAAMADRLDRLGPYGFFIIYALMLTGVLGSLVGPPYYMLISWLR